MQLWLESSSHSINLNDNENGFYLQPDLEGLTGLPEIRTSSGVNAGADGGWTSAQFYDARIISINGLIVDTDVSQLEAKRKELVSVVSQGRYNPITLRFVTDGGNVYSLQVRVTAVSMNLKQILSTQEYLIQLRADDPVIYEDPSASSTEAIIHVQQALGGFEIPFEFPLVIGGGSDSTVVSNLGTETVYPVITLYGPLKSPTVVNKTTNQQFQIIADLSSGDKVVIDSQLRSVSYNGQNAYYLKADGSEFISLAPGNNVMFLTSAQTSDGGYAGVKFKGGHLTI